MKSRTMFLFIPVIIILTGCYMDMSFERPEIISVTPAHNSSLNPENSVVVVNFNKEMDTVKTNNEFSLSGNSGSIEGTFAWENGNKRLVFSPRVTLLRAEKYTIRITTGAEDIEGNDLKNEYISLFFISGDNVTPGILSFSPEANSIGNLPGSTIVISFSEPVDVNSIYGGISVTPSIPGSFSWNTDSTVITYKPLYGFNYGVTYTVAVNDSVADMSGNKLTEELSFNFTVGDDFTKPELNVYQQLAVPLNLDEAQINHGAEKNKRIVLSFSEIIRTENIRNAISITPSPGFYISSETAGSETRVYINLTEYLVSEETYTLRVNSNIADLQGNTLVKDYRYVFVTDGIDSIAPVVNTIGDLAAPLPPALPYWSRNSFQLLLINPSHPLLYPDIIVDFSSEIDPLSLSIYSENTAGSGGSPSIVNIDWPDAPPVKFTRLKFGLYNIETGNIYKIVIKGGTGGLKDLKGNYMKKDFEQLVKF